MASRHVRDLGAISTLIQVEIAVLTVEAQERIPDACTYFTPASRRMYSTASWQSTLQPRLLAGETGERELLLLAYNGFDHFDAVLT